MSDSLLGGFRALDLTDEKGFFCGKILATLGVDTIKIEKPGGEPARNIPPFYHNISDPEKSLNWFALNANKRSITLDLENTQGKELFKKLVQNADFVIESFPPGYMGTLGLSYQTLSKLNPRIIMTSITAFGQNGPYHQYKGCELVTAAMGGTLHWIGEIDRPPVKEPNDSCIYRANIAAALGTMISHYHREVTGEGQQVDISLQDVAANRLSMIHLCLWEFGKTLWKRSGNMLRFGSIYKKAIWPCKDGYVFWTIAGGRLGAPANRNMVNWMEEEKYENPLKEVKNWENWDISKIALETFHLYEASVGEFFLKHTKQEIIEQTKRRELHIRVVNDPADVLNEPQLASRNYWIDIDHPELDTKVRYPQYLFKCSETENFVKRRAPLIGEDNDEIYRKELGLSDSEISALKKANVI